MVGAFSGKFSFFVFFPLTCISLRFLFFFFFLFSCYVAANFVYSEESSGKLSCKERVGAIY